MKRLLQDRTTRTLLLAVVLIVGMGSLRSDEVSGVYEHAFWMQKVRWRHCADVVIAGDSRVGMGISPAAMAPVLGSERIVNYGFNANGYSRDYLAAIGEVLDPTCGRATVILGITPRSLTASATKMNFFKVYGAKTNAEVLLTNTFAEMLRFVEPMSFSEAWDEAFPQEGAARHYRTYHENGWVAGHKTRIRPESKLDNYRREFQANPVREDLVAGLLEAVAQWRREGVTVVGFRPPSTLAMVELENEYSGFDEADFVKRFEQAGGRWVALEQDGYLSFDGSHLDWDAARELSADLAERIAERRAAAQ